MTVEESTIVLGRGAGVELPLPHDAVSKRHAKLDVEFGVWRLTDLASRHGTFLNEVRLRPNQAVPLRIGDVIRIRPWALLVTSAEPTSASTASMGSADDPPDSTLRELASGALGTADRVVRGLVQAASTLGAADSESDLASALVHDAVRLTGFARAALVRPLAGETLEVLAAYDSTDEQSPHFRFSRSLVRLAMQGRASALTHMPRYTEDSVAELGIVGAVCAPVLIGGVPASALYLDSRSGEPRPVGSSELLTVALAEIAAPSFTRVRARSVNDRLRGLERDLEAAAVVQRAMLPSADGAVGGVEFAMRSLPGRIMSGDLFDVMATPDGRTLAWLGDVSGKGPPAAMIMAQVQGGLRTAVRCGIDPFAALEHLGVEVQRISDGGRFVTLMFVEIAADGSNARIADFGHGLAALVPKDGAPVMLDTDGVPPLGVAPEMPVGVTKVALGPGDHILFVSDGVIDQPGVDETRFGVPRVLAHAHGGDPTTIIDSILRSLTSHMRGYEQFDDVTIAVLRRRVQT
jgi:hypothetical protein